MASTVSYIYLNPQPEEPYFAGWILGSEGTAQHYFPNDNPSIVLREEVSWTLGVSNHMGSLQYVVLRVKLLNSTMTSPNATLGQPSPAPTIVEFARILLDNETWSIPFVWEILNYTYIPNDEGLRITDLSINQNLFTGQFASTASGQNLRFVFEVWYYDTTNDDLAFAWQTQGVVQAVWTQIWFNVIPEHR